MQSKLYKLDRDLHSNMSLSLVTFLLTAKHASPIQIQAFFWVKH